MKNNGLLFNIKKSWWVFLFMSLCLISYDHAVKKKNAEVELLSHRLTSLEKEEKILQAQREDLALRIYSQEDKDWMELVLMKKLGVVPEGQLKVYFKKESSS